MNARHIVSVSPEGAALCANVACHAVACSADCRECEPHGPPVAPGRLCATCLRAIDRATAAQLRREGEERRR